jgi:hypothetical protein
MASAALQASTSVLMLLLGLVLLILVVLLIVVIESVILQLLRWGNFKRSLSGALWMNAVSSFVGLPFVLLVPRFGYPSLLIGWTLTVVIEALVLTRLKPETKRQNWVISIIANITSYLILILPSTMMAE